MPISQTQRARDAALGVLLTGPPDLEKARRVMSLASRSDTAAQAYASRALAELGETTPEANSWRDINLPADPDEVNPLLRGAVARLCYERGEWLSAATFFNRLLEEQDRDFPTLMLSVYNLEQLGRSTNDTTPLIGALELLSSWPAPGVSEVAELAHARGHLNAALSKVDGRYVPHAIEAQGHLAAAVDRSWSYTSCLTSLGSELGDHGATVADSIRTLTDPSWTERLGSAGRGPEALIVLMEVVFYLGHALSAIGEFERSRECFAVFESRMNVLQRSREVSWDTYREAKNHCVLFQVKLEVSRCRSISLDRSRIDAWLSRLEEISFRSVSSIEVGLERRKMIEALGFMREVCNVGVEKIAGGHASDVMARLVTRRQPNATLPGANGEPPKFAYICGEGVERTGALLLDKLADLCVPIDSEHLSSAMPEIPVFIAVGQTQKETLRYLSARPPSLFGIGLVHEQTEDAHDSRHVTTSNVERACDLVRVVACVMQIRRFLADQEYVFSLVPCIESPAVRYQRPRYWNETYMIGTV